MLHYFILFLCDCNTEPSGTQKGEIYSNWFHPHVVNLNGKPLKETHQISIFRGTYANPNHPNQPHYPYVKPILTSTLKPCVNLQTVLCKMHHFANISLLLEWGFWYSMCSKRATSTHTNTHRHPALIVVSKRNGTSDTSIMGSNLKVSRSVRWHISPPQCCSVFSSGWEENDNRKEERE